MDEDPVFTEANTLHVSRPKAKAHATEEEVLEEVHRQLGARPDPPGSLVLVHTSWGSANDDSFQFAALRFERADDMTWRCVRRGV